MELGRVGNEKERKGTMRNGEKRKAKFCSGTVTVTRKNV